MDLKHTAKAASLTLALVLLTSCAGTTKKADTVPVPTPADHMKRNGTPYRLTARVEPLANYHYMAGYMAELEGDLQGASENYRQVLMLDPDAVAIKKRMASILYQANLPAEALKLAEQAIETYPDDMELLNILGQSYSSTRQPRKAIEAFRKITELDPYNPEPKLNLAVLYGAEGMYDMALGTLEPMFEGSHKQNAVSALYYIGVLAIGEEHYDVAEKFLLRAGRLGHLSEGITLNLGAIYDKQGKKKLAEEYYQKTLEINPQSAPALENLSQFYLKYDRLDDALKVIDKLIEVQPGNASAIKKRALILLNAKQYETSTEALKKAIPISPEDTSLRYYLGMAYEEMGKYEDAIEQYRKLIIMTPTDVKPYLNLGYLYSQMGMNDKAGEVYESLIEVAKEPLPEYYVYLSRTHTLQGEPERALEVLNRGLGAFSNSADLHFSAGVVYDKLGDMKNMESHMRQAIEIDPNHADSMNFLGYSLAEQDRELDYALGLIEMALDLKPGNGYITDSLGWVYFKLGRYEEALGALNEAKSLVDDDPVIYEHLGFVYEALGEADKALGSWNKALEMLDSVELDEPHATELRERLLDKTGRHGSGQ